jgi:hypothetical protein
MHRGYSVPVRHLLREGKPTAVRFDSAYRYAQRLVERLGPRPNEYPEPFTFIRKMACDFGWDWGPNLVTAGIWPDRAAQLAHRPAGTGPPADQYGQCHRPHRSEVDTYRARRAAVSGRGGGRRPGGGHGRADAAAAKFTVLRTWGWLDIGQADGTDLVHGKADGVYFQYWGGTRSAQVQCGRCCGDGEAGPGRGDPDRVLGDRD